MNENPASSRFKQGLFLLPCAAVAAAALSQIFSSDDFLLGSHVDTPGKVFMAERAYGIRDGLSDQGIDVSVFGDRFEPIDKDRNAAMSMTLAPIYEDAYDKTMRGEYEEADLDAYLTAIEIDAAVLKQQSRIVTEAHWDVAREEPVMASIVHDLDTLDTQIYDAMWTMRAKAEEIGGAGRGESVFDLMMMEVAHDDLREIFAQDNGRSVWSEDAARSFEGFLVATGIVPAPNDVVSFSSTVPQPIAANILKVRYAEAPGIEEVEFNP
ncbi:hypothetical protein KUV57_13745 [Epibacterium sp. DP7N7-1]|nr:hypothetical protein [Epibacterium sp. DP7N7-1]